MPRSRTSGETGLGINIVVDVSKSGGISDPLRAPSTDSGVESLLVAISVVNCNNAHGGKQKHSLLDPR